MDQARWREDGDMMMEDLVVADIVESALPKLLHNSICSDPDAQIFDKCDGMGGADLGGTGDLGYLFVN